MKGYTAYRYSGRRKSFSRLLKGAGQVLLAVLFTANLVLGAASLLAGAYGRLNRELAFGGLALSLANFMMLAAAVLLYRLIRSLSRREKEEYRLLLPFEAEFLPAAFLALSFLLLLMAALHFEEAKIYYMTAPLSLPVIAAVLCPALCGLSFYWCCFSQVFFSREGIRIRQPFRRTADWRWREVEEIVIQSRRGRKGMRRRVILRSGRTSRSLRSTCYGRGWRRFEQVLQDAARERHIPVKTA